MHFYLCRAGVAFAVVPASMNSSLVTLANELAQSQASAKPIPLLRGAKTHSAI